MKRVLAVLVVILITVTLTGCASNGAPSTTQAPSGTTAPTSTATTASTGTTQEPAAPVSLTYWALARWSGVNGDEADGQVGDWQRSVAQAFMESNPGVEAIEFEHIPAADIEQKLTIAIASNTQPDVLEDGALRAAKYARMGKLIPVGDYFTDEEKADFLENSWENGGVNVDGKYHMIPWSNSIQVMLVNESIFEQAGAADLLPSDEEKSWTYDEFSTALAAVSGEVDYPCSFFFGSTAGDAYFYDFLYGAGARIFDNDGNYIFNSPETARGLEYIVSLLDYTVPGAETLVYSDDKELFKQQRTAVCYMGGAAYAKQLKDEMKEGTLEEFSIGLALYPHEVGKQPALEANYIGYMVFASGDGNRESMAVELAKFATNTENSKALKIVNLIPLRLSCGDIYDGDPAVEWQKSVFKYSIDPGYAFDLYPKVTTEAIPMMQALAIGSKDVQQALDDLTSAVESD